MSYKCKYCKELFIDKEGLKQHRVEIVDKRKFKSSRTEFLCLFLGFEQDRYGRWSLKIFQKTTLKNQTSQKPLKLGVEPREGHNR